MSIRTILVGLFAAICGIAATVGVNQMRSGGQRLGTEGNQVVIARTAIGQGKLLTREMLQETDWPSDLAPNDSFTSIDDVAGQYAVGSFVPNEPLIKSKLSTSPTFLKVPEGYRGVTIQTRSEAAMVGRLLAPGNRVDLIFTLSKQHELLGGPLTLTLLENVAVLAVGQKTDAPNQNVVAEEDYNSVTLLVKPEMAEEINLAAELGSLNLTLRSNDDILTEAEPLRKTSLRDLLTSAESALSEKSKKESADNPVVDRLSNTVRNLEDLVKSSMTEMAKQLQEKKPAVPQFEIEKGMRAVSLQTPDDEAGVAGLIQPGDRVDVLLTTSKLRSIIAADQIKATTITLLENIQVLAVGNQVQPEQSSPERTLANSVTLMVTPEMAQDLNLGSEVGTLRLALRSPHDEQQGGPRRATNLALLLSQSDMSLVGNNGEADGSPTMIRSMIRVNRGGITRDIPVIHHVPVADNGKLVGAKEDM